MRIYIDCSFIDFDRQPTGIPRVVLKYIEEGYRWSRKSGIEVIPVVTTAIGLVPVRPVPGSNPPAYVERIASPSSELITARVAIEAEINKAAYHLQAAMKESGAPPLAEDCLHAARDIVTRLTEKSISSDSLLLKIEPGDILFCPAYWHDVSPDYFKIVKAQGVKIVTLVHDILPVSHSKFYQAPWKYDFARNLIAAIRNSDALYAVSQYTADSLVEFAARNGLESIKVGVSYNGFDELLSEDLRKKLDDRNYEPLVSRRREYKLLRDKSPFLMVGTLEPKKGHIPTIRSFEAMWDAGLERPLVVIGRKGWMERSVVDSIEQSRYYRDRLFWFSDFDDFDLYFSYRHCRGLIFSSYAEGFGIPMIEALSAGRPVVALSTIISREIIGDYGLFFGNFVEFADHIIELDSNEGFNRAVAASETFCWPKWREVAISMFDQLFQCDSDCQTVGILPPKAASNSKPAHMA